MFGPEGHGPKGGVEPVADSGLAALVLMLKYLQKAADADQLRHGLGHGDPSSVDDLIRLAKREGVRARSVQLAWQELCDVPLPTIAEGREGFYLLGQANADQVLVQNPFTGELRRLDRAAFEAEFSGRVILLTTRESVAGNKRKFNVSWFIPALVRYRMKDPAVGLLDMAVRLRRAPAGRIFHSDHCSQHCSYFYQKKLQACRLRPSMGSKSNCGDNSAAEVFLKPESGTDLEVGLVDALPSLRASMGSKILQAPFISGRNQSALSQSQCDMMKFIGRENA